MASRRHSCVVAGPDALALAEGCSGTALLLLPGPVLRSLAGKPINRRMINVARVLGARQLLQSLIIVCRPTRQILQIGTAVDALHATTMLAGAVANVGPRRLTLASAAMAGAFTAAGVAQSCRG